MFGRVPMLIVAMVIGLEVHLCRPLRAEPLPRGRGAFQAKEKLKTVPTIRIYSLPHFVSFVFTCCTPHWTMTGKVERRVRATADDNYEVQKSNLATSSEAAEWFRFSASCVAFLFTVGSELGEMQPHFWSVDIMTLPETPGGKWRVGRGRQERGWDIFMEEWFWTRGVAVNLWSYF